MQLLPLGAMGAKKVIDRQLAIADAWLIRPGKMNIQEHGLNDCSLLGWRLPRLEALRLIA